MRYSNIYVIGALAGETEAATLEPVK